MEIASVSYFWDIRISSIGFGALREIGADDGSEAFYDTIDTALVDTAVVDTFVDYE